MIARLRELYEHRELLRTFIARDLNARYKGSIFGIVWSLLNPLLNMVVYSVAFSVILRNPAPMTKTGAHAYAFFFMPSFLAWTFFQGSLAIGTMSILGASGLVKKVYFPREVLPLSAVVASLVNMGIALAVLVPFSIFVIGLTLPGFVALVFVTALFFLLTAGMTMVLAGLVVYFRDIEFLIGIILSAWFFLTPIVWATGTLNDRQPAPPAPPAVQLRDPVHRELPRRPLRDPGAAGHPAPRLPGDRPGRLHRRLLGLHPPPEQHRGGAVSSIVRRPSPRSTEEDPAIAVAVRDVHKHFRLFTQKETSLKATIVRGRRAVYEEFEALKGVSFDVPTGEVLGIIGRNGSGKSTLLKCMARILEPDAGTIEVTGRIAALLEVGAGFHPEYSAIENIFLSGAIYGVPREDLEGRVDEIIRFAELERFARNPVKTYSSGMYARLGFSIAINVDPDVLLVDEVLAVGDQSFQARCLDRMLEFRDAGKTIILVTHDVGSVESFCDRAIWLNHGEIVIDSLPHHVIRRYVDSVNEADEARARTEVAALGPQVAAHEREEDAPLSLTALSFAGADGAEREVFHNGEALTISVHAEATQEVADPVCEIVLERHDGVVVAVSSTRTGALATGRLGPGPISFDWAIDRVLLTPGTYYVTPTLYDENGIRTYDRHEQWYRLRVHAGEFRERAGATILPGAWRLGDAPARRSPAEPARSSSLTLPQTRVLTVADLEDPALEDVARRFGIAAEVTDLGTVEVASVVGLVEAAGLVAPGVEVLAGTTAAASAVRFLAAGVGRAWTLGPVAADDPLIAHGSELEHLPHPDGALDAVVVAHPGGDLDWPRAMREVNRVIRPGGLAVIVIELARSAVGDLDWLMQNVLELLPWTILDRSGLDGLRERSEETLRVQLTLRR